MTLMKKKAEELLDKLEVAIILSAPEDSDEAAKFNKTWADVLKNDGKLDEKEVKKETKIEEKVKKNSAYGSMDCEAAPAN
ncbi:MAG: hypothetical protein NC131_10245 [Roseburia sp.]|nr:hypothetical protein [Roseburia sp.]